MYFLFRVVQLFVLRAVICIAHGVWKKSNMERAETIKSLFMSRCTSMRKVRVGGVAVKDVEIISSSKEQIVSGYTEKCPLKYAAKFPAVSQLRSSYKMEYRLFWV